jgi:hypothetical protein
MTDKTQKYTVAQWKREIRRLREIKEEIQATKMKNTGLTANVVDELEKSALALEQWLDSIAQKAPTDA